MGSFVFWYKIWLGVRDVILWQILLYKFGIDRDNVIVDQIGYLNLLMVIILFCVMDGMIVNRKAKIIVSISIFAYYAARAISNLLKAPSKDHTYMNVFGIYSFSVYYEMLNAEYSLCIFMLKQTVTLILSPNTCVNIVKTPHIKWK